MAQRSDVHNSSHSQKGPSVLTASRINYFHILCVSAPQKSPFERGVKFPSLLSFISCELHLPEYMESYQMGKVYLNVQVQIKIRTTCRVRRKWIVKRKGEGERESKIIIPIHSVQQIQLDTFALSFEIAERGSCSRVTGTSFALGFGATFCGPTKVDVALFVGDTSALELSFSGTLFLNH